MADTVAAPDLPPSHALELAVTKGHGTRNDFVILTDPDGTRDLAPAQVRQLCDRRSGIGGDGLLRAVPARHVPEWGGDPDLWFMDYRNADGSIAEMCGNGLRVFMAYLHDEGLLPGPEADIATRAGLKHARLLEDGRVRLEMGAVRMHGGVLTPTVPVEVATTTGQRRTLSTQPVDVGNPHAVAFTEEVDDLDLTGAPTWPVGEFPGGVNVEFVRVLADDHVRMRVHERGVGETESCGTGTVAAAMATCHRPGRGLGPTETVVRVDVPGGSVEVGLRQDAPDTPVLASLTGPAVLVYRTTIAIPEEGS